MKAGKRARAENVFQLIRQDILGGELVPGERLTFPELGGRYDASVGAIREALVRLAERGLVSFEANLGFRVTAISGEGAIDLADARSDLESLAVRRAIADGSLEWESSLVAAAHRLAQTRRDPLSEEWHVAHADFHLALLQGCANPLVLAAAQALRDRAELYRRWTEPEVLEKPNRETEEHQRLVRAAVSRDAETTVKLLRKHIAITRNLTLRRPHS